MLSMQSYQTLIVGLIGFTGVVATLLFNAWQGRKLRVEGREHEARALRAALIEELKIHKEAIDANLSNRSSQEALVPTDRMDDVYRAFVPKIGILSETEVRAVMFAYLSLRNFNDKLFLIGVPLGDGTRHVSIPVANSSVLFDMYEKMVQPVDNAISALTTVRR